MRGIRRTTSGEKAESRVCRVLGEMGRRYSAFVGFDREVRIIDRNMEHAKNACTKRWAFLRTSKRRAQSDGANGDAVPTENVIRVVNGRLFCWELAGPPCRAYSRTERSRIPNSISIDVISRDKSSKQ